MILTNEQQAILNGEKGETLAKVMETVVRYGELFGAEKLVPVTSKYNHLVTSFGLKVMSPVYDLMQQLLDAGVCSDQKFSVDPRPLDRNVPANFLQNLVFNKFMYTKQDFYEKQLEKLGFFVLPSDTNFLFAKTGKMDGGQLYETLKSKGILVRHFGNPKISQYNRITIGTREQMEVLINTLKEVLL